VVFKRFSSVLLVLLVHPVAAHVLFQLAKQRDGTLLQEGVRSCKLGGCVARLDGRSDIEDCVRKTCAAEKEAISNMREYRAEKAAIMAADGGDDGSPSDPPRKKPRVAADGGDDGRTKMSLPFSKKQVAEIITEVGAGNLTLKGVRERLEQSLGMEINALKQYKQDILMMIEEVLKVCAHSQEPVRILRHVTMRVDACHRIRQRRRRRSRRSRMKRSLRPRSRMQRRSRRSSRPCHRCQRCTKWTQIRTRSWYK